jgi:acetylornithine deacetylase/succinyl-diaminopimelate desuccinylase-like protein
MKNAPDIALQYVKNNRQKITENLASFVRIPSISTNPENQPDMLHAAEWVANLIRTIGFQKVEIYKTNGHPIVYAEELSAGTDKPTILVYGHYDVQPVEPLDLWHTPPLDPVIRGEYLFGRGTSDMKGQVIACIGAVEAVFKKAEIPVNIKFMLEGEEEIGSPHLPGFMENHADVLACDFSLNADTGMIAKDIPTITYGLRGLAYFELRIKGPAQDLHSGLYGGAVHNPAQVLSDLISGMHDKSGHITLPGFYDRVIPLTDHERADFNLFPIDDKEFIHQTGVPALWGEEGYSPVERIGGRPTLEINGLYSGYTGEGSKTIIPSWAMAKISMRLVPDQDPAEVAEQLKKYVQALAPRTVTWEIKTMAGGKASISDRELPATQAMARALKKVWGVEPVYRREGGSVPVVGDIQTILGAESILIGFGLPDDNIHAPNEKLHLPTWYHGIDALVLFLTDLYGKK